MRNAENMTRKFRARLTAVVSGALMVVALGATAPAMARTIDDQSTPEVRVEKVESASPVMVEDLTAAPASVTETAYCAVYDGTFGCDSTPPPPGTGLVVAELYQHANRGGWRVVVFNPAYSVGCSSGTGDNEGGADLGAYQNAVSSLRTYNGCDIKLFDREGWNGGGTGWIDRSDNLGSFNDWADSFAIS